MKFIFLFILISQIAFSQNLQGIVIDQISAEPVVNAVIQILEDNIYETTDLEGTFSFENIRTDEFSIKVTHISYQEEIVNIDLSESSKEIIVSLTPKSIAIEPVVVTDRKETSKFSELDEAKSSLKGKELQRDQALSLAATLKNETGLAVRSMGPAPARPVIRGLSGDRVEISEDQIPTADLSATSPDHALTLEPFTVDKIEVIRGPKILIQNSSAVGGIINTVKNEIPVSVTDQIHGSAGIFGESANSGYLGSLTLQVPFEPFALRLEASRRKADDQNTPAGKLNNTSLENVNYAGGLSLVKKWGFAGGSYRFYDSEYGIPGGFVGAHPNGVKIKMRKRHISGKAMVKLDSKSFNNLEAAFNRTYYNHKEFESSGLLGAEFVITTHQGFFNLNTNSLWLFNNGTAGLSFEARDFKIGGFVFTPFTKSVNVSGYVYQNLTMDKFNFEFSVRYSFDNLKPEKTSSFNNLPPERTFNSLSASALGLYGITDNFFAGLNLSRTTRTPTIEELYNEGPHLAAYSYEVGNPNLPLEEGFGSEVFVYYRNKEIFFNLNFFHNNFSSYIIHRNSGDTAFSVFLPIYSAEGVKASLTGVEGLFEYNLFKNITLSSNLSYTYGKLSETNSPLPSIPPLKNVTEIKYKTDNFLTGLTFIAAASQRRVDVFEEPTDGYFITDVFAQYSFIMNTLIHNISLTVENIFNTEYRNHLSRIKSIMPESGINFRGNYKLYF